MTQDGAWAATNWRARCAERPSQPVPSGCKSCGEQSSFRRPLQSIASSKPDRMGCRFRDHRCDDRASAPGDTERRWRRGKSRSLSKQPTTDGLALFNYHDDYGSYPPAYIADESGRPMHSWRVLILPYLGRSSFTTNTVSTNRGTGRTMQRSPGGRSNCSIALPRTAGMGAPRRR